MSRHPLRWASAAVPLLLLALASVPPATAAVPGAGPAAEAIGAEPPRQVLERVLAEHRVEREAPEPGLRAYAAYLVGSAVEALVDRIVLAGSTPWTVVGWALVIAAVGAALWVGGRALLGRTKTAKPAGPAAPDPVAPAAAPRSAAAWRELVGARLDAGDLPGALEALWWWAAGVAAGGPVDPSWTSRELLAACRHPGLRRPLAELDRLTYSERSSTRAEIESLSRTLEGALAGAPA
ncbi:MAG: hypothetical protein R2991_09125 [Thermoanaerobaculia bacterium]